jgi:quinol monooxygenase YgiN
VTRFGLVGRIDAHAGQGDELAEHLLEAARLLEPVGECELYVVSRDPGTPDAVWVAEVWRSRDAHTASLELESVRALIARARPLIAGGGERFELLPVGGKGLG